MEPQEVTLLGGPWDGMTLTTTTRTIIAPGDGYDTWHYHPDLADHTAPWPGTWMPSPIRYTGE